MDFKFGSCRLCYALPSLLRQTTAVASHIRLVLPVATVAQVLLAINEANTRQIALVRRAGALAMGSAVLVWNLVSMCRVSRFVVLYFAP